METNKSTVLDEATARSWAKKWREDNNNGYNQVVSWSFKRADIEALVTLKSTSGKKVLAIRFHLAINDKQEIILVAVAVKDSNNPSQLAGDDILTDDGGKFFASDEKSLVKNFIKGDPINTRTDKLPSKTADYWIDKYLASDRIIKSPRINGKHQKVWSWTFDRACFLEYLEDTNNIYFTLHLATKIAKNADHSPVDLPLGRFVSAEEEGTTTLIMEARENLAANMVSNGGGRDPNEFAMQCPPCCGGGI